MKTLILDASYEQIVALLEDCKLVKKSENRSVKADKFMELIDLLLKECSCNIDSVDEICVNVGPGSFTGIRVAVSVAKGLGITKNIRFKIFNSFDYFSAKENVVLPGFSNFVYIKKSDKTMDCVDKNELDKNGVYVVSDNTLYEDLKEIGLNVEVQKELEFDKIDAIVNGNYVSISEIRPLYLRKSQAEIQRDNKLFGAK